METEKRDYSLQMLIRLLDEKRVPCREVRLPFRSMKDVPDNGLRSLLYGEDTPLKENFPNSFRQENRWLCYSVTDSFQCHYFFLPPASEDTVLVFGPYIAGTHPVSVIRNVRRVNQLTASETESYRQYSTTLPHIYDAVLLESIFRTFCTFFFGEDRFQIIPSETAPARPGMVHQEIRRPSFHELEKRYADESLLINSISKGDYENVKSLLAGLSYYGMESRSGSLLRDAKNYLIVFNTLCRLSVYQGGAHPLEIDSLSREYSFRIENAEGFGELKKIQGDMILRYCTAVSADHRNVYSLQVKRAVAYCSSRFREPVTLAAAADELGITKTYLSALFRKETGLTFSEYMRRLRLSAAADLLKTTHMTIDEIASYCGIPDTNYFARLFRREYGMSPVKYRASARQ